MWHGRMATIVFLILNLRIGLSLRAGQGEGRGAESAPVQLVTWRAEWRVLSWQANPKTKERRKEMRYAFPAPYPKLSIKQRQSSSEEVEAEQEQHADSCPSLWNHEVWERRYHHHHTHMFGHARMCIYTCTHTQIHAMWLDCDTVHSLHYGHVGPQALQFMIIFFIKVRKEEEVKRQCCCG